METVRSRDGTEIAFERSGAGEPLILVSGASTSRSIHDALAELLSGAFSVINYDRRGRGESGNTPPYAVEREIEDLQALIEMAGGSAALFGNSSGAVLALRAAAAGLPVTRLALWEPPYFVDPDAPRRQQEYLAKLTGLLDAGRPGEAMALFMSTVGVPAGWAQHGASVWTICSSSAGGSWRRCWASSSSTTTKPGRTRASISDSRTRQPARSSSWTAEWSVGIGSAACSTNTAGPPDRGD